MKQETEIEGFRPLHARVNERGQIQIDRSDPSDPSDLPHRSNYLQTPYNEDHYDQGWSDGFKARGSWIKIGVWIIASMLALAAAITLANHG